MSTLYEITGDYLRLLEMLDSGEDIDPRVVEDTLAGIDGEFELKAEGCAKIIRELDAEAKKFEDEIERMTARKNAILNNSARVKKNLYDSMKSTGKLKFKTELFSFGIQKNGGKKPMEIDPEYEIPDEYCEKIPDKKKIRDALDKGVALPFAFLKDAGDHLRIR